MLSFITQWFSFHVVCAHVHIHYPPTTAHLALLTVSISIITLTGSLLSCLLFTFNTILTFFFLFVSVLGGNKHGVPPASTALPFRSGAGRSTASQAFVILAGQALPQSTLFGAVDVCFKAFYVLDINYPKQCAAAWEFLQQVVFEIEGRESNQVKGEVPFFTTYTLFLA